MFERLLEFIRLKHLKFKAKRYGMICLDTTRNWSKISNAITHSFPFGVFFKSRDLLNSFFCEATGKGLSEVANGNRYDSIHVENRRYTEIQFKKDDGACLTIRGLKYI